MRPFKAHGPIDTRDSNDTNTSSAKPGRAGVFAWVVSAASLAGLIIFYLCMLQADREGGHVVWPVYGFAGSAFIASLSFGFLFSKYFTGWI